MRLNTGQLCLQTTACLLLAGCMMASDSPSATAEVSDSGASPASKVVDGKEYGLVFADEFDGSELDMTKWNYRIVAAVPKRHMVFTKDAAFPDGKGNLVMPMYTVPRESLKKDLADQFKGRWVPCTSMIKTRREFTYGYHEVRLKMPIVKGVGMSVWMQSRGQTMKPPSRSPKVGTEIDLLEQTFFNRAGEPCDYMHSTIHWGGYGDTHQWYSITVKPRDDKKDAGDQHDVELNLKEDNAGKGLVRHKADYCTDTVTLRDEEFHTIGLLWTPDFYKFYYDGEVIGIIQVGVSESPEYMILWPRLFSFAQLVADTENGLGNREETKAKYLVDYYRVYMTKEQKELNDKVAAQKKAKK